MNRGTSCAAMLLAVALTPGCGVTSESNDTASDDRTSIEAALKQWSADFTAENQPGVCDLFAADALLESAGGPNRSRDQFCTQMQALFDDPTKQHSYRAPDVHEVIVDGDLAAVRLSWELTIRDASGRVLDVERESGLDVFRRQADGTWKIYISHAFPKYG